MKLCVPKGKKHPTVYDQQFIRLDEFADASGYSMGKILRYLIKNGLITKDFRPSRPMLQEGLAVTDENVKGHNVFERFTLTSDGVIWLNKQMKMFYYGKETRINR